MGRAAAEPQVLLDVQINSQLASLAKEVTQQATPIPASQPPDTGRLSVAEAEGFSEQFLGFLDLFGLINAAYQLEGDPLLNLRVEIQNLTDSSQYYFFQIRFATDVITGPTFQDAYANMELIDNDNNGLASVTNASTWFEVIDDPGGDVINGARNLGQSNFFSMFAPGQASLFDNVGAGPNASDFDGVGFNYLRFAASGYLSAGDKLVITGMGAYANSQDYLPERYEITEVPEPASLSMLPVGFLLLRRRG